MTTVNRRISDTLDSSTAATGVFEYRTGRTERRLLVVGSGEFDSGTVTLYRADPGSVTKVAVDSWTADFVEYVEPIVSGDYTLEITGGSGSEDIDVSITVGPVS